MKTNRKITDIVIPINDFILEPDTVAGGLYICKSGGAGLLAKMANKDNKYLIEKFFNYLYPIKSQGEYERDYYYNGMKLPPIMLDHLLDHDEPVKILTKIKDQINKNAKWMDKNGILAIVDMTFDPTISFSYQKINVKIKSFIIALGKHYKIHLVDNCDTNTITNLSQLININGNISVSSKTKFIKCSDGNNYDVYSNFIIKNHINPDGVLFIETLPGYIKSINNYSKFRGIDIKTILYDKLNYDTFIKKISNVLDISLDNNIGEFVPNKIILKKEATLMSSIVVDNKVMEMRKGCAIVDTFIYNGKMYEKLIRDNGDIICTVIYSDKNNDNNERTILLMIDYEKYKQIYLLYQNTSK